MAVRVRCITDPACIWSWAVEPAVRALMVEFGAGLEWTFVMGGLAREFDAALRADLGREWLDASARSGMPADPRTWHATPPASSYPACLAVKAAQEQGPDAGLAVLRGLREGLVCLRRKLDHTEALAGVARAAGLDEQRFRLDAHSNHAVERFGEDIDVARELPPAEVVAGPASRVRGDVRTPFPAFRFAAPEGGERWVVGLCDAADLRAAALSCGAEPAGGERPAPRAALRRFGPLAAPELAAVCDLGAARAELALAELVAEGHARTVGVLAGRLYEAA